MVEKEMTRLGTYGKHELKINRLNNYWNFFVVIQS
jgi:hypothetical protein